MKVLSIDLDYIMGPVIELYQGIKWNDNPLIRWKLLYNSSDFKESHFYIDQSALLFCYEIFLKSIKKSKNVFFGYDHDSILYKISELDNLDIINIDHHDDIFHVSFSDEINNNESNSGRAALRMEYDMIINCEHVNEGNWGAWLYSRKKLNSFTWIHNETSRNVDRLPFIEELMGNKFSHYLQNEYSFDDYEFDYVFVCFSPQYIPQNHWHYFTMFMMAYEQCTGKKVDLISDKKFEIYKNYERVTNEILYKRSNGR
jgi:hypothetical protein